MKKKSQGMSLNGIIILGLLILVVLAIIFTSKMLFKKSPEPQGNISPSDAIKSKDIFIANNGCFQYDNLSHYIVVRLNTTPTLTEYVGSGSMLPTFGYGHNGIEIPPSSEKDLNIGDIISFYIEDNTSITGETLVVHRIINISHDAQGWVAITKGDNNPIEDPWEIRYENVHGKTAAIIY